MSVGQFNSRETEMRVITCVADIEEGLAALVRADSRLAPVRAIAGEIPLRRSASNFASLASIIVSQQVSTSSAKAIHARLAQLIDPLEAGALLAAENALLRQAGLSGPKQRALTSAARAVHAGDLDLEMLAQMPAADAIAAMTSVKGIGPWTAEIFLLVCAGHPDIFPAGDLALQEAVRTVLALDKRPGEKELRAIAEQWSPWRSVASRLLWSYYGRRSGRDVSPMEEKTATRL
jgi:DNA-3-methyladenine glycosylase II